MRSADQGGRPSCGIRIGLSIIKDAEGGTQGREVWERKREFKEEVARTGDGEGNGVSPEVTRRN